MSQSTSQSSEQEIPLPGVQKMLGITLGGRYKIISHLGGGGYGQTYLAEDIHLPNHPQCVVKQLKPQATDTWNLEIASRLFNTEAEVLYKLGSHDQIPRLYAHFEENKEFYLVQEFIEGGDLSQELASDQKMNEAQVISFLQQTLEILEFVHQQRVIHRDINPRNLIRRKQDNKLVLIDFGAVKQISTRVFNAQGQGQTSKTVAIGTMGYMPIEQVNGNPRFSSDIYAVGMIAIQALTGLDPSRHQLPRDPETGEIFWHNRAAVNPSLAKIIDRMVLSHFQDRYQAASEVLHELKSWQDSIISHHNPINSISSQKTAQNSPIYNTASEINPLPRSNRSRSIKPVQIWIGLAVIAAILMLFKLFTSTQLKSANFTQSTSSLTSTPTPTTATKTPSITPIASPIPAPRLSRNRAYRAARFLKQGDALRESGQHEKALGAYNNAVAIKPDYAEAYWGRCFSFGNLQRYDEALATCDLALQVRPNYAEAWWSKGYALDGLKRYEEALATYDQALKFKPTFSEAWSNRGATLVSLQRYEEALTAYDQALKFKPNLPEAWNNRGVVLANLKRYQEAIASYDKAIQIKPDYKPAIENRRRSQQALGK